MRRFAKRFMEINCIRRTPRGLVAADLTISEGGVKVKFNVYLQNTIELKFASTDRGRAEFAADFLRLMDIDAEVRRMGGRGVWYVLATTDRIAAARRELRNAIAEVIKAAAAAGWIDVVRAERWLEKLKGGLTLREGWPKYNVQLVGGALVVRYQTTNPGNMEREVQRLEAMGLEEGVHFAVRMPEGGKAGYILIRKEGLAYVAWLSIHGSGKQRRLAAEFINYVLQRAREKGEKVYKKALEAVRGRQAP
jgi:hypothetical protein